jgi:hypothetical protein
VGHVQEIPLTPEQTQNSMCAKSHYFAQAPSGKCLVGWEKTITTATFKSSSLGRSIKTNVLLAADQASVTQREHLKRYNSWFWDSISD